MDAPYFLLELRLPSPTHYTWEFLKIALGDGGDLEVLYILVPEYTKASKANGC